MAAEILEATEGAGEAAALVRGVSIAFEADEVVLEIAIIIK